MSLLRIIGEAFPFVPERQESLEKDDLARAFHAFVWLESGSVTLLFLAVWGLYPTELARWLAIYISLLMASLLGLWLNRKGNTRRAVIGLLAALWGVMTLFTIINANIVAPNGSRYVLIVVAAGLLLGRREGIITAIISGFTEIALDLFTKVGADVTPGHFIGFGLLVHLATLALAAMLPALATRSVRNALSSAKEELEERRRAELALQENEARYAALLDKSPDAILIHRNGRTVYANPASLNLLGARSEGELMERTVSELIHPDSPELIANSAEEMQEMRTSSELKEGRMLRLDGTVAEVEAVSMPISFRREPAMQTIIRDVTDKKMLQEQVRLQVTALNSAANGIIITDKEGTIVWVNAAFEKLTGYSMEESIGRNPRELVKSGRQTAAFYREMWETIKSGKVWHGELLNRRRDGTLYTEMMTITPVHNDQDNITHFVAVKQDVTSQKLLEDRLLQAQKLEGIGQLAGGVAHDYNNILNVVLGYGELMKRRLADNERVRQPLDAIVSAAKRGADLSRQLLAFARKEMASSQVLNINQAVDSIRNMLRRIVGINIKIEFIPGNDLWTVKIDPTQFDQILVNLSSNARDAMKDNGTITIRTDNVRIGQAGDETVSNLSAGEYVKLEFEDTGRGMDQPTLNRVFEPFFSTKPKGHGTGLGLSTVYGIIKQNGGAIDVRSEPENGAVFIVYLPRYEEQSDHDEGEVFDDSLRGDQTVLVVEDQSDLLDIARTTLEEFGYTVMTSVDPSEALLLSDAYGGEIHILLTDVVMPKMGGVELSSRISRSRPLMKTLYMSGFGEETVTAEGVQGGPLNFIPKPFSPLDLARKIKQVLSA